MGRIAVRSPYLPGEGALKHATFSLVEFPLAIYVDEFQGEHFSVDGGLDSDGTRLLVQKPEELE